MTDAQDVLAFWFDPDHEARWFERDDAFDAVVRARFGTLHQRAAGGELDTWMALPEGWMALLLVLDQFSRNLYRGDPRAFACDARAQRIALEGIAQRDQGAWADRWGEHRLRTVVKAAPTGKQGEGGRSRQKPNVEKPPSTARHCPVT